MRWNTWFVCFIVLSFTNVLYGQGSFDFDLGSFDSKFVPDYTQMTLDFRDVTSTNLNQTVAEGAANEKAIDFGDFDKDGDLDVVIGAASGDFGERLNKLYRNDGGILNEISGTDVIPGFASADVARDIFMRDYDRDGFLDIVVICDGNSSTNTFESAGRTKFYRNMGGIGYVNESNRIPMSPASGNGASADFNNDGWEDIYFGNHPATAQDRMGFNLGTVNPGSFIDVTAENVPLDIGYTVDVSTGDMNNDGTLDLLICNSFNDQDFIYYNNNFKMGSGIGDFRYSTDYSQSVFSNAASFREQVLLPADFNNDGMNDIYSTNRNTVGDHEIDVVYQNIGNDEFGKAEFLEIEMSEAVFHESNKVDACDLDGDGKLDLIVMSEDEKPVVFRNISADGGTVKFIQWTPDPVFNILQRGWLARGGDILGDSRPDLLIGASQNDFLIESRPSMNFEEKRVGGIVPSFHGSYPIAVVGQAATGEQDTYSTEFIPVGARVSILVRSMGDVELEVYNADTGILIDFSDQGFVHTSEGVEFVSEGGSLEIRVTMNRVIYDGDADGDIDLVDEALMDACIIDNDAFKDCQVFDITNSDGVNLLDKIQFRKRMNLPVALEAYVLECNSSTN